MTKQYCLITGCSEGGIGYSLVEAFANSGVHVFATARTPSKMAKLESNTNVTLLSLDVTSPNSISEAVLAVKVKTGSKLDYLVNNSGVEYVMPIMDTDIEKAKAMYDVNVWGVVAVIQAFGPLIVAAKGSIVNIASVAGCVYPPFMGHYAGSKAAIDRISETLRLEMQPLGVKVVTVITGSVKTNLFANLEADPLPVDSYYRAAEVEFEKRSKGTDVATRSDPEGFARNLTKDVIAGATGHVYRGHMSSTVRYASTFLPTSVMDRMTLNGTGLDKVKPPSSKMVEPSSSKD